MPFIRAQHTCLNFKLRRSRRAKRLQMLVQEQQFEVIAPMKVKNSDILVFVKQHLKWMLKQSLRQTQSDLTHKHFWPRYFLAGEILFLRAKALVLNVKFGEKTQINCQDACLNICVPWQTKADSLAQYIKQKLVQWYQQQALQALEKSLAHYCPLLGRWPKGYQVKLQKTRWGSCGIGDKIHINWLLILAPKGVLEYVVLHELCHLFHRNHSKRFWAKVATFLPEYEKSETWLRQNGHLLHPKEMLD